LETLFQDIRYGLRMLMRNPASTVVALLSLTLGIGATTATFSFFDAVLLKPLAFKESERLVTLQERSPEGQTSIPSPANFLECRTQTQIFSYVSAYTTTGGNLNLTGVATPERIRGAFVSANYFEMLGIQPALGRTFNEGEDQIGQERIVMLTNGFWRKRFGSDPGILGKGIVLNQETYSIVGVLSPDSPFERSSIDVWLPLVLKPEHMRPGVRFFSVYAKLQPGFTLQQAQEALDRLAEGLERDGRSQYKGWTFVIQPMRDTIVGQPVRKTVLLLMGAVFSILIIGCGNVANVLLAVGAGRYREVAIRAALGAGRTRLLRQFLTESLLLAALGGCAGLISAVWLIKWLTVLMPPATLPDEINVALDYRVLVLTATVSLFAGALFGAIPALRATKLNISRAFKGHRGEYSMRLGKTSSVLLISEIALSFILVMSATLLIRSFASFLQVNPGFRYDHMLTFKTDLPISRYREGHQLLSYQDEMLHRLRSLPLVRAAAVTNALPMGGSSTMTVISAVRPAANDSETRTGASVRIVSPDYFDAMGIGLVRGRFLSEQDNVGSVGVVVLNQALSHSLRTNEDSIGNQIVFASDEFGHIPFLVVGVVADVKHWSLASSPVPEAYLSYQQTPPKALASFDRTLSFLVRTNTNPSAVISTAQGIAADIDKDQPLYAIKTMEQLILGSLAQSRFRAIFFGIFGVLAVAFAATGLFGVLAHSVTLRTHEIGVRIALGAQSRQIYWLIIGQGMTLTFVGITVGALGTLVVSRLLSSLLFDVKASDPTSFLLTALTLIFGAVLACYIPARRATRVDPLSALRSE
jgi:putative ABC transport system permease protein